MTKRYIKDAELLSHLPLCFSAHEYGLVYDYLEG